MIAKAKAISYGINDLRYITGESKHKKHPEKIYRVLDNLVPPDLDAMGIWNSMQLTLSQHRPIKNSIIRIELSPSPEHTSFYDIEDWQKLWHEFAEEFDKQVISGKDGKVRETWLEDCGRNPKSQHSGSKQRVHGGIENHAIVVMGRIQEGTCQERLFRI